MLLPQAELGPWRVGPINKCNFRKSVENAAAAEHSVPKPIIVGEQYGDVQSLPLQQYLDGPSPSE